MLHLVRSGRSRSGRAHHIATSTIAAVTAAVALCALAPPEAAQAGEYDVHACRFPDGRSAPADGWYSYKNNGGGEYVEINCAGQGLVAELDANHPHPAGSGSNLQLDAPPNLSIVRFRVDRERQIGYGQGSSVFPVTKLEASAHALELCIKHQGCGNDRQELEFSFSPSQWVAVRATCDGSGTCSPEIPKAKMQLRRATVRFRDDAAPVVRAAAGSLLTAGTKTGVMRAALDVSDAGGGVKDAAIVVDGTTLASKVLDANGGTCAEPFSTRVPCALTVSSDVDVDTSTVADGTHELTVVVRDAADNATRAFGPRTVTFDNRPPTMTDPSVTGQAQEGQRLTCAANALSGQSPRVAYAWTRSRADGSGETVIAGATAASYLLVRADVDRKIRCRLTASDGGGSTTRSSGLSSGPFADGATVKAAPAPPPATTTTPPPATTTTTTPPATTTSPSTTPTTPSTIPTSTQPAGGSTPTTPVTPTPTSNDGSDRPTTVNVNGSSSSSSSTTGSGAGGGSSAAPPAPARTGAKITAVFASTGQAIAGTAHGRTVAVRGQLDDRDGAPIPGGLLELVARADVPGAPERPVATARSRADGTFGLAFAARLPTSELVLRHKGANGATLATTTLDLRVAAGLTLRATRRVQPRGLIRFSGRLLTGPIPRRGKVIELRARGGNGKWILFKSIRTRPNGTFRASYRLKRGFRNITYQFQAVARAESGYPYTAGASPVRRTRVR